MSGEVHSNVGRQLQKAVLVGIAAIVLIFSAILLTIMQSSEIQLATAIVATGFFVFIAMILYYT